MRVKFLTKLRFLTSAWRPRFFGFFQGHTALTQTELETTRALVDTETDAAIERAFENAFAQLAGGGEAVSFASGRMAFYATLRALGIGMGDEVLLTGFTCAVMANAVWRTGATARYADIAEDTLGTCPQDVARKINSRTRAIVVQHTFGLPCAIAAIAAIARSRRIPLIEDCALTLGSAFEGRVVGSWGDAAIFSTDHSKPLNTMTGGMLVTRDLTLAARVREIQAAAPTLALEHRRRLWQRLLSERTRLSPRRYGRGRLLLKLAGARRKLRGRFSQREEFIFLEADFKPRLKPDAYPYPARLPVFLAQIGRFELGRWPKTAAHRRSVLARLFQAASPELKQHFPSACTDSKCDVVPLRLAYTHPAAAEIQRRMSKCVDVDYIWFREPLVCATLGPSSFGYQAGECPVAERVGKKIINWPCDVPEADVPALLEMFVKCHQGL